MQLLDIESTITSDIQLASIRQIPASHTKPSSIKPIYTIYIYLLSIRPTPAAAYIQPPRLKYTPIANSTVADYI